MTEKLYTAVTADNRLGKKKGEVFKADTDAMGAGEREAFAVELRYRRIAFLRAVNKEEVWP